MVEDYRKVFGFSLLLPSQQTKTAAAAAAAAAHFTFRAQVDTKPLECKICTHTDIDSFGRRAALPLFLAPDHIPFRRRLEPGSAPHIQESGKVLCSELLVLARQPTRAGIDRQQQK